MRLMPQINIRSAIGRQVFAKVAGIISPQELLGGPLFKP